MSKADRRNPYDRQQTKRGSRFRVRFPKRRSSTRVTGIAQYKGEPLKVYTNIDTPQEERVVFPKDSDIQSADVPIGATRTVQYRGREYQAKKTLRQVDGRMVPVLEFHVDDESA